MKSGSLRLRLVAGGAVAIIAALVVAGAGLTYLFERHVLRSLAGDLEIHLRQALASINLNAAGQPQLLREPADPRFAEPLSGLYWQLNSDTSVVTRSRSLWDAALKLPTDQLAIGEVHQHRVSGPGGSDLLAVERTIFLKANDTRMPVRVVIAADLGKVAQARRSFVADLVPSLALLACVLAAAAWVQIGLGLRPLKRVRDGISAIRTGRSEKLDATVPSEVSPLVDEINSLLTAQENDLQRARGRAADLAHGLKTPLSALASDVRSLRERGDGETAARIEEVGEAMRRHVERELARARIRGMRGFGTAPHTPLRPLVEALVSIQSRGLIEQRLTFQIDVDPSRQIAMDKADAAEVIGNLLENASRYARTTVKIGCQADGRVVIEDDGPGVPEAMRSWVRERGGRLDQRPDGAGLGLAIVQDVLAAYDRQLLLETSPLGGLRAIF
ncbi:MAG: sensor histidine kinase [Hyphomicrobium sp.]|nr:sensor histidine kinase [Hyphomicrobium sp.]